jgi:hypothetical protein
VLGPLSGVALKPWEFNISLNSSFFTGLFTETTRMEWISHSLTCNISFFTWPLHLNLIPSNQGAFVTRRRIILHLQNQAKMFNLTRNHTVYCTLAPMVSSSCSYFLRDWDQGQRERERFVRETWEYNFHMLAMLKQTNIETKRAKMQ